MDSKLVDYFIEKTDERLSLLEARMDNRFQETNDKIEPLYRFRWQFAGGVTVLNVILGLAIAIYFGK